MMTPLELAAIAFVNAKTDFDACRYAKQPWRTYQIALKRLENEVADATKDANE